MATVRQQLGEFGEQRVVKDCSCLRCKRPGSLVRLPPNFKCADVICDFCGYLAQVKAATVATVEILPRQIFGAAWGPQRERMEAGIYFPALPRVGDRGLGVLRHHHPPADLERPEMFKARKPLSATARRAGWTGFLYDLEAARSSFVRLR